MAKKSELVLLLLMARYFDNQTCCDSGAVATWRRKVDAALEGTPGDDPCARFDTPDRVEHRQRIERMFENAK